jgi:hypothetical protein
MGRLAGKLVWKIWYANPKWRGIGVSTAQILSTQKAAGYFSVRNKVSPVEN